MNSDTFSNNVLNSSKDFRYKNLKLLIQRQNLVILQGDENSGMV